MKQRSLWMLGIVMYIVCAIATCFIIISSIVQLYLSHGEKFLCAFVIFASGFMATRLLCTARVQKAYKIRRISHILLFIIYVIVVIDFTLVSGSFGRNVSNIFTLSTREVREYISANTNIIPFATVRLYINAFKAGKIVPFIVAENLLGNLFVFMPLAFFVPALVIKINSTLRFFAFACMVVLIVELLQIIFMSGSADIDDFILNVAGAMTAYGVLQIQKIKEAVNKYARGSETDAGKG